MAGFMKKLFRGTETPAEEKKEATALKSGKITPKQYVAGEKAEGHGAGAAKKAAAIKSGKMTPAAYAKEHAEKKATGGKVKKMAMGGMPARDIGVGSGPRGASLPVKGGLGATGGPKPSPLFNQPIRSAPVGGKPGPINMVRKATGGGVEAKGKTAGKTVKMAGGGCAMKPKKMAKGGGVESKGKTRGKMSVSKTGTVKKMAKGGGVESKGKTRGKVC